MLQPENNAQKTLNLLYLGDVMAEPGLRVVEQLLPQLRKTYKLDLVIAQAENVSDGKGVRHADFKRLLAAGVDFCTGGNHTLYRREIYPQLNDPKQPIIRPANYPNGTPGLGHKYIATRKGDVLVVSLLGQIVGKDAGMIVDNPLHIIDDILVSQQKQPHVATVVNFHGDFSSEKRIIGYYLDGRVTAVIGDHWHVPTADAEILPRGTAHVTDVGMCGSLDSSLGIKFEPLLHRWRDQTKTRNIIESAGRMQFNALYVQSYLSTGLTLFVEHIQRVLPAASK